MVWFALTFVTLTAFAGLAIEYNRWENIGNRVQKAADAAALAGAVFMPENIGNKAFTTAKSIASQNGFTDGSNGIVITTAAGKLPNQLKVVIKVPTKNPFGGIIGYGSTTIQRVAVAEYQLPQNMGAPQNYFGNDPESAAAPPQFWGNVFGPSSNKSKGDATQSASSRAPTSLCDGDNCPSGVNKDYEATGYFYGIDVPAGATGALNVQVFDPAFVHVGDQCGDSDGNAKNSLDQAVTLTAAQIPGYSGTITPAVRYASAGSSAFCTGDNYYGDGSNTQNPWTVWTLRGPDVSSWDPTNNPILCQAEFPGVYPETSNDQPNGTIERVTTQDAPAVGGDLRRHQPATHVCVLLPAVGADLQRREPRPGHVLPPGADGQQDRRHADATRRRVQPILGEGRPGVQFRHLEQRAGVREPEDEHLRQRNRCGHALLSHARASR